MIFQRETKDIQECGDRNQRDKTEYERKGIEAQSKKGIEYIHRWFDNLRKQNEYHALVTNKPAVLNLTTPLNLKTQQLRWIHPFATKCRVNKESRTH